MPLLKVGLGSAMSGLSGLSAMAGTYADKVKAVDFANLLAYWQLNEAVGPAAADSSGNGYDGAEIGAPTWGQVGIGDGQTSVLLDGTNDAINVFSTGFRDDFDNIAKDEGSIMAWIRVTDLATWTDGSIRDPFRFQAAAATSFVLSQKSGAGNLANQRRASGTSKNVTIIGLTTTIFFHLAYTWSVAADEFKVYLDGEQQGATQTGNLVWNNLLASTATLLGAATTAPLEPWKGYLAHIALWETPLTADQIVILATV